MILFFPVIPDGKTIPVDPVFLPTPPTAGRRGQGLQTWSGLQKPCGGQEFVEGVDL